MEVQSNTILKAGTHSVDLFSGQSLYSQAREKINVIIKERNLSPGHKLPSIREISSAIGVTRGTAAKAIAQMTNEGIFISKAGKGVYINKSTVTGEPVELQTIYILSAGGSKENAEDYLIHNPFWNQILSGVRTALQNAGSNIRFRFSFLRNFLMEKDATPRGRRWNDIGFMILGDCKPSELQEITQLTNSVVLVHGITRSSLVTSICADCAEGSEMLVDHLVGLGHRRIAFCGVIETQHRVNYEKYKGFRNAMQRNRLPVPDAYCRSCLFGLEEGYRVVQPLLKLPEPPTAIVIFNDETAIGAMRAIRDAGLTIPRDISVTGFDNIATSSYIVPSLTTVSVKMSELGQIGVARLFEVHRSGECEKYMLKPELIVRESTGPVKNGTP
ncbi:MAG: GntR family transcriptional regulator [Phycisphaerae bacterium]